MKEIIKILEKIESLEKELQKTSDEIVNLKQEIFGINEGDLITVKSMIIHELKLHKLLNNTTGDTK